MNGCGRVVDRKGQRMSQKQSSSIAGRGALALVDAAKIRRACALVVNGEVHSLNRRMDEPPPGKRPPLRRTVLQHNHLWDLKDGRFAVINDDSVEFGLQSSSQWDTLAHYGVIEPGQPGVFHGEIPISETRNERAETLGIDGLAEGVATRGVLLDMVTHLGFADQGFLPGGAVVTGDAIEQCLRSKDLALEPGDAVLVYTGFSAAYQAVGGWPRAIAGLDSSSTHIWRESKIGALIADNPAVDRVPIDFSVHTEVLRGLGVLLGEMWQLESLVEACRSDNRWEFLLVSAPLNIPGAFGSPANALALR
jgi:hypothetical protein